MGNGPHFKCMINHRGDRIKSNNNNNHHVLKLQITADLLDTAMQSGASADKIEAMLIQKRSDDGVNIKQLKQKNTMFHHTKYERDFNLRNLKHRFWNHEVLVRVFIQNGWLTSNLAHIALKTFIKTIYHRVLKSKSAMIGNSHHQNNNAGITFSENFLHSFFVSYFCLDDIPKMYKKKIKAKRSCDDQMFVTQIAEETLRRWCELIELLASRGADVSEYEFRKIIPLQYALKLGKNTYQIICSPHKQKNKLLIPTQFHNENISIPDDTWDVLVSYL